MTRAHALKELLGKVEAGEKFLGALAYKRAGFTKSQSYDFQRVTADGSLDAAKSLHEAVLPGWSVDDLSQNGLLAGEPWGIRLEKWDGRVGEAVALASAGWGHDNNPDNNPARAWLIAILKALIAEEGE